MKNAYAVSAGVWEIVQDTDTNEVYLYKYGDLLETWQESKRLTWEEMYEILSRKSNGGEN